MAKKPDTPCAGGCGKLLWSGGTSLPAGQRKCRDCRRMRRPEPQKREPLAPRSCAGCGANFIPRVHYQVRCKKWCGKNSNGRALRVCEICEAQYKPSCKEQRTCGRICGAELRRRLHGWCGNKPPIEWPRSRVYFPACGQCGRLFTARSARRTLCSPECQRLGNLARIKERYETDALFRDQVIARAQARRASKLGVGDLHVTLTYLIRRDRGRCGICHKPVRAKSGMRGPSIDHIVPLSRGGRHELANVHLTHLECNLRKHAGGGGEQQLLVG